MSGTLNTTIPAPAAPIADEAGNVTVPWRAYFLVLQRRTGGTVGVPSVDGSALVGAERAARIASDDALGAAISAEAVTRGNADTAEATARANEDGFLAAQTSAVDTRLSAEITRAMGAEALLVPIASLCSLWAGCDLSFLPVTDPGGGRPWNDGGHLAIGGGSALIDIGLEDASGTWLLEDGSGSWEFS